VTAEPIFYDLKAAAVKTGLSVDLLKAAIHKGTLRAKATSIRPNGRVAKYIVTPKALADWCETLEDA
jgi:hypothetical protein